MDNVHQRLGKCAQPTAHPLSRTITKLFLDFTQNFLHTPFGTLGKWEQRLFSQGFIRIHRSTIVNFHAIYSWHYENKNIVLNMRDGKQIRVSKSYKAYFLSYVR
jgi:hypothetical protein